MIAHLSKSTGALPIAVVTVPFALEGRKCIKQAEQAIAMLQPVVDSLILASNNKLLKMMPERTTLSDAFQLADTVLVQAVKEITDIIIRPGLINVDFADIRAVMEESANALIGVGSGSLARETAAAAIASPLNPFKKQLALSFVSSESQTYL